MGVGSAINIALTGLDAASKRIEAASNNIANASSTARYVGGNYVNDPFKPQEVVQESQTTGGTLASIQNIKSPSVPVYDPDSGIADAEGYVQYPNVSLEGQAMDTILARNSYRSAISVIKSSDEMMKSLLDIES